MNYQFVSKVDEGGTRLLCFGANDFGQLGQGETEYNGRIAFIDFPVKIISIASGHAHTLAATEDGSLYGWGTTTNTKSVLQLAIEFLTPQQKLWKDHFVLLQREDIFH
jgi:alpha-tubulin suppressor-like RCC1 family protein